jgi:hypothetical protein
VSSQRSLSFWLVVPLYCPQPLKSKYLHVLSLLTGVYSMVPSYIDPLYLYSVLTIVSVMKLKRNYLLIFSYVFIFDQKVEVWLQVNVVFTMQ